MEKIKGTDIMGIMAFLKDIADLMLLGGEQDGGWQTDAENGTNFANSVTKNSENEGKPACELQTARRYASLTVFVDPGHGSATKGKQSPDGKLREYSSNRQIASEIEKSLDELGIAHCRTVDDDTDPALSARAGTANRKLKALKAADPNAKGVFLSVHSDAAGDGSKWMSARGWSAWTTKGATNSDRLADCLYDEAEKVLPKYGSRTRTDTRDGDRDCEENFTVIYKAEMPAVLTENLFHDNREDVALLNDPEFRKALGGLIARGIAAFAEKCLGMRGDK